MLATEMICAIYDEDWGLEHYVKWVRHPLLTLLLSLEISRSASSSLERTCRICDKLGTDYITHFRSNESRM